MSFDVHYPNRKDRVAPYHGSARFDRTCRPGGSCPWCARARQISKLRIAAAVKTEVAYVRTFTS